MLNILLLFTDQQRFDTIGALGAPIIKTPALDRLVREGVSFERCHTPSPVCVSARHALTTGLPPHTTGCVDNQAPRLSPPTFIEHLRDAGYQAHGVGKMHFAPDPRDMKGFETRNFSETFGQDEYAQFVVDSGFGHVDEPFGVRSEYYYLPQVSQLPATVHHTHWVADKSIEFLQNRPKGRPFFLWSSFIKPHPPFESPTPWNKLYRAAEMPPPYRPDGYQEQLSFWNRVQNRYKYRDAGTDDHLNRTTRAAYYSSISFIDYNIGRILEALGESIDETLVVFTSDHGEMLGDFGAFGKRCMLDGAVRVPLILRWPNGHAAGTRIGAPVSLVDLYPTFLGIAGRDSEERHPESVDLRQPQQIELRKYVYSHFSEREWGHYLITDGKWKYSYCAADEKEWLYDLGSDHGESRNLIDETSAQQQGEHLRARLIERFEHDGYTNAVHQGSWKRYGISEMPEDADFGLLFQDPEGMQAKVDRLGEYSRRVLPDSAGQSLLSGVRRRVTGR